METLILKTLETLKYPKIKITHRTIRKQILLFEPETTIDLQFNGFYSLAAYQAILDSYFYKSKETLQAMITNAVHQLKQIKQRLDQILIDIKLFRKRYYPKHNQEIMFSRVEVLKSSLPIDNSNEFVKKS